jgi:hypothetical protein
MIIITNSKYAILKNPKIHLIMKRIIILINILVSFSTYIYSQCLPPQASTVSICSGTQTSVVAVSNGTGVTAHRWYTDPTGGGAYQITSNIQVLNSGTPYVSRYSNPNNYYQTTVYYVSSVCGSTESSRSAITINITPNVTPGTGITSDPVITGGDANGPYLSICNGTGVTFTANSINGGSSPTYKWYSNGYEISGQTGTTYTTSSLVNDEKISVKMTSNASCVSPTTATSASLRMIVTSYVTPSVSVSPVTPTICSGSNLTFTATPVNGGSPSFVWKVDGVEQSGQTGTSFSSTSITNGQSVSVEMTAHNTCQTTNFVTASSGSITVNPNLPVSATISGSSSLCNGLGGSYGANATNGGSNPSYQWLVNNTPVTNNTAGVPLFVYAPTTALNSGDQVSCMVTSNATCATGNPATSNVITIATTTPVTPSVSMSPSLGVSGSDASGIYVTICNGTSLTFTATSSGGGNLQWYSNGTALSGQTGSTYTSSTLVNSQQISVKASNIPGCVTSTTVSSIIANMKVDSQLPVIAIGTVSGSTIGTTTNVTFNSTVTNPGTAPSYQWKRNSNTIVGATSSSYSNNSWTNGDRFTCTIQKKEGCSATSDVYTIIASSIFNQNLNYVVSNMVTKQGVTGIASVYALSCDKLEQTISYFDGLGRPMQTVSWQGSPHKRDVVQPVVYDIFSREERKYLSYVSSTADGSYKTDFLTAQPAFYKDTIQYTSSDSTYARTVFEASPLNRVLKQGAPGAAWQASGTHMTSMDYQTNRSSEVVLWDMTSDSICQNKGAYSAGALFVSQTTDENGHVTKEYKDKEGKVILKKSYNGSDSLQTYYVYDDLNQLRYVLSPKATSIVPATLTPSNAIVRQLCYYYKYDKRKRMIVKQLPGANPVYMVYDQRDRLVLTQDGVQRTKSKWLFTKYDRFNRPVMTGEFVSPLGMSVLQDSVNLRTLNKLYESADSTAGNILKYTNNSYPTLSSSGSCYTVTYYDTYLYTDNSLKFVTTDSVATYNAEVMGKVTGGKVRTLDTDEWLSNTVYYDSKYRVVQTVKGNQLSGIDRVTNKVDFIGRVTYSKTEHTGKVNVITYRWFEYDHASRLVKIWHRVDNGTKTLMSYMQYNELGQLVDKKIHSTDQLNFLQSIDYRYNIRGWLTHINNPDLGTTPTTDNSTYEKPDVFGMEIRYHLPF